MAFGIHPTSSSRSELPAPAIAQALCLLVSTVHRILAEFIKTGRPAIEGKGNRGGRRRDLMTFAEEAAFLCEHGRRSKDGKIRNATEPKRGFETRTGRTFHTNRDPPQTAALKKTPR